MSQANRDKLARCMFCGNTGVHECTGGDYTPTFGGHGMIGPGLVDAEAFPDPCGCRDEYVGGPAWTLYSGGNPRSYRRIYCGRLLYAIPCDDYMTSDQYTWHDANVEPLAEHGPYSSREEAQRAAEAYAEEFKHVSG